VFSSLGVPSIITGPGAIATDCDQALRNALSIVFPESPALLCVWHANKNIQQHCKPMFTTTEAYENFLGSWIRIVHSTTEDEYRTRLRQFTEEFRAYPSAVEYVQSTWLKDGRKQAIVHVWTNDYPHFGITTTSR
jgi:hypothetical protein